jgi:hypothetical protein
VRVRVPARMSTAREACYRCAAASPAPVCGVAWNQKPANYEARRICTTQFC